MTSRSALMIRSNVTPRKGESHMRNGSRTAKEKVTGMLFLRVAKRLGEHPNMHPELVRSMVCGELEEVLKKFDVTQKPSRFNPGGKR